VYLGLLQEQNQTITLLLAACVRVDVDIVTGSWLASLVDGMLM